MKKGKNKASFNVLITLGYDIFALNEKNKMALF